MLCSSGFYTGTAAKPGSPLSDTLLRLLGCMLLKFLTCLSKMGNLLWGYWDALWVGLGPIEHLESRTPLGLSWILISSFSTSVSLSPPTAVLIFPLLYQFVSTFWVYLFNFSPSPFKKLLYLRFKIPGSILISPVWTRCSILNQSPVARSGSHCTNGKSNCKPVKELGVGDASGKTIKKVSNTAAEIQSKGESGLFSAWIHFPVQRENYFPSWWRTKFRVASQGPLNHSVLVWAFLCFSLKMLKRSLS